MKIFTYKLFILLFFVQTAGAQIIDTVYIDSPGIVGGDWTPEHRYIARSNILVPYDSILTIHQGVKIEFQAGLIFKIEGKLIAIGAQSNRIEIAPYQGESWKGLAFGTPSGEENMNTSQLSYVDINCGDYPENQAILLGKHKIASMTHLNVTNADKAIKITGFASIDNIADCSFENVNQAVVYQYCDVVSQVVVKNCTFKKISQRAVYISHNPAYLNKIVIENCEFDNSALSDNHSGSALYINANDLLASVTLTSNVFKTFALEDNSTACIYIDANDNLNNIDLTGNDISLCGGETPTSPNADFGGIYINKSLNVFLDNNDILDNTGLKSGVGYIRAGSFSSLNNLFQDNRNSYTGNEFYAGAITFTVAERIEMNEDLFESNFSAKSGGAFSIESENNANPIDLIFETITLSANSAANEGGAVLINATMDTLKIAHSVFDGNFSSAGSGGCFSLISSALNELIIDSNTLQDNFVSEFSEGGFLYLIHDPSVTPSYGNVLFNNNTNASASHNDERNYSIIYSKIGSFPNSIGITNENVSNCYPVDDYLYHFELLQSGPFSTSDIVELTMTGNHYQDNLCPVFYLSNEYCTLSANISGNNVNGTEENSNGTFVTLECNMMPSMTIEDEAYFYLLSESSGGAVSVVAHHEIGSVLLNNINSQNCISTGGSGGHFSLISGQSDDAYSQEFIIINSIFDNDDIGNSDKTYGDGGAIYYYTPGNLDSLLIRGSDFTNLIADGNGGVLYFDAREINKVDIQGSRFISAYSEKAGGAIYLNAGNGSIKRISLTPYGNIGTAFGECYSLLDGGALYAKASKEIGPVRFREMGSDDCLSGTGNGGHFSFVSLSSDATVNQDLIISDSEFNPSSTPAWTDGNGGAIYYQTPGKLDSLQIRSSHFHSLKSVGSGGALYIDAKEIDVAGISGSAFINCVSEEAAAGAIYINASNGNIKKFFITPYQGDTTNFVACTSKTEGGALCLKASKEIGPVLIETAAFKDCYSGEGNGGHISMVSLTSDPAVSQDVVIANSIFHNPGVNDPSNGDGGAVYYKSPGNLDSIQVRSCTFTELETVKKAGALFFDAKEILKVILTGSQFNAVSSLDTAGAVFINAANGNIKSLSITPFNDTQASFSSCTSKYDGGALCIKASKEIGNTILDAVSFENCYSAEGNGGHLSLISLGADGAVEQKLGINNSSFTNAGINSVTGGNGGIISYSAYSDVASVMITNSGFDNVRSAKNGGSIYLSADKIVALDVNSSLFSSSVSEVQSGGALYLKSGKGLINGSFSDNKFINCTSNLMGGSVFVEDSKYDNTVENMEWSENTFRKETMSTTPDIGGAIYCKGINAVSFAEDSVINQTASLQGGFLYLEKVYKSTIEGIYTYNNFSGSGGVVYQFGDDQPVYNQSSRINNSTFLFNNAGQSGGCFYITNIDSVEIGRDDGKNVFVANMSLSSTNSDLIGGGAFFIENAQYLGVSNNSFYVNKSYNNGGVGIINNIASSVQIGNNNFLSNQADAGGAFAFINDITNGLIADNNFYFNSSVEQGGALLFSPSSGNNLKVCDNIFFRNNAGKLGGAITLYRPVNLIRNLFRENSLLDENPNEDHLGTAIYLTGSGNLSKIKNCVFDKNLSSIGKEAGIYFDASQSVAGINIYNCSFFNLDQYLSLYNASTQNTVNVINSIFTIRDDATREDSVIYFNETVKSRYCDMIYTDINDSVNHNFDEYIYFNIGDYFFDSAQFPVDKGDPDAAYYDNPEHFPPAYGTSRNDLGISGGPDNPDSVGTFLFEEPAPLSSSFDIVVTNSNCFTYSFECRGDFVAGYELFYWFLPDAIIKTDVPYLNYTFPVTISGNCTITVMGQDTDNSEAFGYGQYSINLDFVSIISLSTEYESNSVPVPSIPFTFNISANIYVAANTNLEISDWNVISSQGVEFTMTEHETSAIITIESITEQSPTITIEYKIGACGITRQETIEIQIVTTNQWGYPQISFNPSENDIPENIDAIEIIFDKRMTDVNGILLDNGDVAGYLSADIPCATIKFLYEVIYGINETKFVLTPVNTNTQLPEALCAGEYFITVYGQNLYSENYRLAGTEATMPYYTDISDLHGGYSFKVYPNPFSDNIHIDFSNQDDYYIEITDLSGRVQKSGYYEGVKEITLNLSPFSGGMYMLHVKNSKATENLIMKINKIYNN